MLWECVAAWHAQAFHTEALPMQQSEIGHSTVVFCPEETLVAVVEMSRSTWLVSALVPGIDRRP